MNVLKNSTTTRNAADTIKLIVPKKNDNLASPFIVFAPATDNTSPTKERDILAINSPFIRSAARIFFVKLSAGKKKINDA